MKALHAQSVLTKSTDFPVSSDITAAQIPFPYIKRGYLHDNFRLFHLNDIGTREFEFHYHDFDKIIIFLSGSVSYIIEGRSYDLKPYDIVLVNHSEIHRPLIDTRIPYERMIVYLSPDFLNTYRTDTYDLSDCFQKARSTHSHVLRMQNPSSRSLFHTIKQLETAVTEGGYADPLYRKLLFLEFMIQLNRTAQHQKLEYPIAPQANRRILDVMDYIKEHLTEDLNVEQISIQFHFSRYHLMRLFKEETGCTLARYIASKRLMAARELLNSDLPLTELCFRCGFQNYSTFSRAYLAEFGESPRQTRKSL